MDKSQNHKFPYLIFLVVPLVVIIVMLLMYLFLDMCMTDTSVYNKLSDKGDVMGVSSFSVDPSVSEVNGGDDFTYKTTITSDSTLGVLTTNIVFDLTGEGVIGADIDGPGLCQKVSDIRAVCTGVNILPEATLNWTLPVTANESCANGANSDIVLTATHAAVGVLPELSESGSTVSCIVASDDGNGGDNGDNNDNNGDDNDNNGGNNGSDDDYSSDLDDLPTTSGANITSDDILAIVNQHNKELKECFVNKSLMLAGGLALLWLLGMGGYYMMNQSNNQTTVSSDSKMKK